ncbi:hypothetical protein ACWD7C_37195 [Streptomyces sp. NPDC005134]|uniref:hypothetical protein n=1 Tax=unclassified Streptomyces TaxID=2593676 RepID=UPI0033AD0AF7
MRASPSVRSVRAVVFAVLCVLLAAGGHALATGAAPPVWVQVVGFVPVFAGGCLLGGRERSLAGIGGGTLAAQGGLHVVFDAGRPHAVMGMHTMQVLRMGPQHALTPHATAVHIAAAVFVTWWLRRGEAALWSLLRRAVAWMPGPVVRWHVRRGSCVAPVAVGFVHGIAGELRPTRQVLLRHAVHRRGPPTGIPYVP